MSKKIKEIMEQEFKKRFEGVGEFLVVSLRGVNGNDNNVMRGDLLDKQIEIKVIKNSLAVRAFDQLGIKGTSELFSGPCAIVYGGEDIVSTAKELVAWDKKLDKLEVKGGYLDGQLLGDKGAKDLAKMLSRSEQQAVVVQLAQSPGSRLAGAVGAPAGIIAGCIKTLLEKLEDAA